MTQQNLQELRQKTEPIFRRYKITKAGVFGSFARGEEKRKSDIDLLVRYGKVYSLFKLIDLKDELAKKLGRDVDLVDEECIKKQIRPYIEKDLVTFYEKR